MNTKTVALPASQSGRRRAILSVISALLSKVLTVMVMVSEAGISASIVSFRFLASSVRTELRYWLMKTVSSFE